VAERLVERQRMMDGSAEPAIAGVLKFSVGEAAEPLRTKRNGWSAFLTGLGLVVAGALVGLAASVALLWDRLAAMGIGF
jgi:hypothetical protein